MTMDVTLTPPALASFDGSRINGPLVGADGLTYQPNAQGRYVVPNNIVGPLLAAGYVVQAVA